MDKKEREPFIPSWLALLVGIAVLAGLFYLGKNDGSIYFHNELSGIPQGEAEIVFIDSPYAQCYISDQPLPDE